MGEHGKGTYITLASDKGSLANYLFFHRHVDGFLVTITYVVAKDLQKQ